MDLFQIELGRRLSAEDVSSLLGVDVKTVRRYYKSLGGVRIGKRRIIFFERSVLNALQKQAKSNETMDGTGEVERQKASPVLQDEKRSRKMGGKKKKRQSIFDEHNLLA